MALDPQAQKILEEAAALGLPAYQDLSPTEARKQMLELAPPVDPLLSVKRVEDRGIPGPESDIPIRLYYPMGEPPYPVLVYFHGGGWVIGDLDTHHGFCHALAKTSNCLVVSVDYRLAPEHRYPAAVEDATAAYRWIISTGVDPTSVVITGDSAGGGLTLATLVALRDAADPLPAAAVSTLSTMRSRVSPDVIEESTPVTRAEAPAFGLSPCDSLSGNPTASAGFFTG